MAGFSFSDVFKGTLFGVGAALVTVNSAWAEAAAGVAERDTIVVTGVRDKGIGSGTKTD